MQIYYNYSLNVPLRELNGFGTVKAISKYQLHNYFPNKPGGRYVLVDCQNIQNGDNGKFRMPAEKATIFI
jgi:hypothetical protein